MDEGTWFSARLLFEAQHPDEEGTEKVFEDRIVLLRADDKEDAASKTSRLGAKSGDEYFNQYGGRVIWQFVEVLDLVQLSPTKIASGTEVYSQFLDEQDPAAVRRSLQPGKLGEDE